MTTSATAQPLSGRADVATVICVKAIKFTLITTVAVCCAIAMIALVSAGSGALNAVLFAGTILVVVFGPGLAAVTMVSRISPPATLLVGLMTYVLQMVVLIVVLQRLAASDWLHGRVDPSWLGATLIVVALACTAALITVSLRARVPAFAPGAADLPVPKMSHLSQTGTGGTA
ncbi:MAG TPA: hypothetical protein P5108_12160 [Marmoricola sp.]|nr:hypothetical protein [Marmoricola sp.]